MMLPPLIPGAIKPARNTQARNPLWWVVGGMLATMVSVAGLAAFCAYLAA